MRPYIVIAGLCILTACQTTQAPAGERKICNALDAWIDARTNDGDAAPISLDLSQDAIDERDVKLMNQLTMVQDYNRYAALETCLTGRVGEYDFERQDAPITVSHTRAGAVVQLDYDPVSTATTIFLTPTGTSE